VATDPSGVGSSSPTPTDPKPTSPGTQKHRTCRDTMGSCASDRPRGKRADPLKIELAYSIKKIRSKLDNAICRMMRENTLKITERKKSAHLKMISMAIGNHFSHVLRNKLMQRQADSEEDVDEQALSKMRALTFGDPQQVNLNENEKILKSIAEWSAFEEAVILSKDMQFPSRILKDHLDASKWNNIPIPLKEALDVIKASLLNTERLVLLLCRESRYKSENTSLAIKNITG